MISLAFVIFCVSAAQDYVWAKYMVAVAKKQPGYAAGFAGLLQAGGAVVVVAYIGEPLLILVSMAGAMFGTYIAVMPKREADAVKS